MLIVQFVLLAIFVVTNVLAVALGKPTQDGRARAIPWLQRSTTAQLALMAWLFYLAWASTSEIAQFSRLVAIGITISFVADLIMGRLIPTPNRVIFGIGVFSLAHISYIVAFFPLIPVLAPDAAFLMNFTVFGLVFVGIMIFAGLVYNREKHRFTNYAALVYTLLIAVMAAITLAIGVANPALWLLAAGGLLFLASDAILGNQIFRDNHWPMVSEVVWAVYVLGQAAIVWSNLPALQQLGLL